MARISWQEAAERFSHLDARFVRAEVGFPGGNSFFTLSLYPWWEHPLYLKARDEGARWGFADYEEGYAEMTVYPKTVRQFRLSPLCDVTDWDFCQDDSSLWQYERHGTITCNSPLTLSQWMEIYAAAGQILPDCVEGTNAAWEAAGRVHRWGHAGSFFLGNFPRPLFNALRSVLDTEGISYFAPHTPEPTEMPVLFSVDQDNYIIADDFEVDVPEFIHNPEWFQPHANHR